MKGWPDLTLWRPRTGEFLIRELKKDGEYPTPDQRRVLADLEACGVNVGVWRPKNWDDEIVPTLTARKDRGRAS